MTSVIIKRKLVSAVLTDQSHRSIVLSISSHRTFPFYLRIVVVLNEWNEMIIYFSGTTLFHKEGQLKGLKYVTPHNRSSVFGMSKHV